MSIRRNRSAAGRAVPLFVLVVAMVGSACTLPHLPPVEQPRIPPLPQTSLLFDANGKLITALHAGENRTLITLDEMAPVVREAVVAIEDERFYQHRGIDAKAILRATVKNATNGRLLQ